VLILKEENRRLFGEQVNDHIEKLNDLMSLTSGVLINDTAVRRACLATRLLEGSTRMLGFDGWSRTLLMFRELLEKSAGAGRCWDEQLSQIVSEVLETEEQMAAEILAGELEEIERTDTFTGLQREIDCIATDAQGPEIAPISLSKKTPTPARASDENPAPELSERLSTLTRLIDSLVRVREMFHQFLDQPARGDKVVRELEIAFGESEFFMELLEDTFRRLGRSSKPFIAKIPCATVLEGVKDFFGTMSRLRRWRASLATRCVDCTLDREIASTLAVILDESLCDICRRYEVNEEVALTIGVDVKSEGSHLVVKIQDNAPDYWRDTEIDREDVSAFYQCLREVRGRIEHHGALLWVEPSGRNEGRFKFTLPRTKLVTDYHIVSASGKRCAVPCHSVDSLLGRDSVEKLRDSSGLSVMLSGMKVPVYALDELAYDENLNTMVPHDHVLVIGVGELRVGILIEGIGRRVEGVADQLTAGNWAGVAKSIFNIGEEEFPILDVRSVLHVVSSIRGTEGGPEEPGSYVDEADVVEHHETAPRA
jgi:hypothetical protein